MNIPHAPDAMNLLRVLLRPLLLLVGLLSGFPLLLANDIQWQSLDVPATAVGGTTIAATAVVTNTGGDTWGGAHNLVMLDASGTPVAMESLDGVEPGQTVTKTIHYGFPDVAATYTFQFQALEHEVEYFGPVFSRTISVTKAPAYLGMQLSTTTFDALAPALISTTDSVVNNPPYRLRAKVIDGTAWGWHAANLWNVNGQPLDNPPPAGNYAACYLYWVRYTTLYGSVLQVGPERVVPISVLGTVSLSTNWAHASNPPKIFTNENMAGTTYRLFATFKNSAGTTWETSGGYNNNGASLANLPPPGSYQVDLQWKKFDTALNVTAASSVRTATVSVTDGPIVVLAGGGYISGTTSGEDDEGNTTTEYSTADFQLEIPSAGILRVRASAQDGGEMYLNAYAASGQHLQSGIPELSLPVTPGAYSIIITADRDVAYTATGEVLPHTSTLAITSPDTASGNVGAAFAGYAVTTNGSGAITFGAPSAGVLNGLPPGLAINATTGAITGTPTAAGTFRVWVTATNAAGSGYKWVTFSIGKGTPTMTFNDQTFVNESIRYISPYMLAASVTGTPGSPPAITGASAISYRITQGVVSAPTGSIPLGKYLTPWYSPITITATYPGDANYVAATTPAVFKILVQYTPSAPSGLRQVLIGPTSFSIEWQYSSGLPNLGIFPDTYDISFDGGAAVATTVSSGRNTAVFNHCAPSTTYNLVARGRDAFGNQSAWSAPLAVTTLAAGTTATYTPRWFDVNGDGLLDEVIDAGTPVLTHFVGEESSVSVTYDTWVQHWSYVPGYSFHGDYYADGSGRIYYVAGGWVQTWEEEEETISVPIVRPVFRFVAEGRYDYKIGRLRAGADGRSVFDSVVSIAVEDLLVGVNEWWPDNFWSEPAYYTLPFVLVRQSFAPGGCVLNLPGIGAVSSGARGAVNGAITLSNGTRISAGGTVATITFPAGGGTITIDTAGNVTGSLPGGVTHVGGQPSVGLPGGLTVTAGVGEVTIASANGVAVTVGTNGIKLSLPSGLASLAGMVGGVFDELGKLVGLGSDPAKTRIQVDGGEWKDLNDPALGTLGTGTHTVGIGVTDADARTLPRPANIITIAVTVQSPPPPRIAVDANRDGAITFESGDATSATAPYQFWINDDIDRSATTYCVTSGSETEQDDKHSNDVAQQDWRDNTIACERDLEDFARIQLSTSGLSEALKSGQLYLGLKWKNTIGTPAIKLHRATDTDGSIAYLTTPTAASRQALEAAIIDVRYPGYVPDGQFVSNHTLIEGNDVFVIPSLQFINLSESNPRTNFLYEGCKVGSGQLALMILKKESDGSFITIGEGPGVWLKLDGITGLYERHTVGDDPLVMPATTAMVKGSAYPAPTKDEEKDYILYVHGYNMPVWEKERWVETIYKRTWHLGYKGRVGIYEWPCTVPECVPDTLDNFDRSEFRAWQSATGLRDLLTRLKSAGYRVRVIAHSQGNVVASEALRQAGANSNLVHTYAACQGALAAHCFNPTGALNMPFPSLRDDGTLNVYAQYQEPGMAAPSSYLAPGFLQGSAGSFVNFYNQRDYALSPIGGAFSSGSWQTDNQLKPNQGYGYNGVDGFFKSTPGGGLAALRLPGDRHEIFSFGAESRSFAVGAAANVGGAFGSEVNLDGATYNFGPEHIGHSAEFRSYAANRRAFWVQLLVSFQLRAPE